MKVVSNKQEYNIHKRKNTLTSVGRTKQKKGVGEMFPLPLWQIVATGGEYPTTQEHVKHTAAILENLMPLNDG